MRGFMDYDEIASDCEAAFNSLTETMQDPTPQAIPQVNESLPAGDARAWGNIKSVGTSYGKLLANFLARGAAEPVTVTLPANLEQLALIALRQQLHVLASFDGPRQPFASMTDLTIYN